jgi:hypothetical protein
VVCVDYATEKSTVVEAGDEKTIGAVTVTVHASREAAQSRAAGKGSVVNVSAAPPPPRRSPPVVTPSASAADAHPRAPASGAELTRSSVAAPPPPKPRARPEAPPSAGEKNVVRPIPLPPPPKKKL